MSITLGQGITVGNGITLGTQTVGFTISPADFTNYYWGGYVTPQGNTGFVTGNPSVGPGWSFYAPRLGSSDSGSDTKLAEIKAYFDANGLDTSFSNSYMFNVSWNPDGSTITSGVAILEFFWNGPTSGAINMGAVDTGNPAWETSGSNYYNGPPYSLVGTFNLPATFTVITPLIINNNNWC